MAFDHRKIYLMTTILLLPLLLPAQWVETTIYVPDSLCGVRYLGPLTYNAIDNTIYVGGDLFDHVIAIDGATDEKIAKIAVTGKCRSLCWNSTNNKVYYADSVVTVIDGAINEVICTIPGGTSPWCLVYNSTSNKIYCANLGSANVTVIDGATNAVIITIGVDVHPYALVYNPTNNIQDT